MKCFVELFHRAENFAQVLSDANLIDAENSN